MKRPVVIGVVAVAVVLAAGVAVALGLVLANRGSGATEEAAAGDVRIVIPEGTGARIDAGETVDVIPAQIRVAVGQRLVLRNDDDRPHIVGPYAVAPGQELRARFDQPGTFSGSCTVHPSQQVEIVVR